MKPSLLFLFTLMCFVQPGRAQESGIITADQLKTWTYFLAGDEMKGRRNGSPEMLQAAQYISDVFRGAGLKPAVGDTSFYQEYVIKGRNNISIQERNVVGMLEGSDPELKNEWIILSAHFDHIGIGKPVNGDSIYNGADDNATGTATLMALAQLLSREPNRPKRSILFAAFSGEEMGLRGSRWMLDNPLIPMEHMKLNLNFEMTGEYKTLGDKLFILTGYQYTNLDDLIGVYNQTAQWKMATKMLSQPWVFMASDNATFALKRGGDIPELNYPAFTLVTTDAQDLIHKVTDEPQFVEYENMASFTNYVAGLISWLASGELDVEWDRGAFEEMMKK